MPSSFPLPEPRDLGDLTRPGQWQLTGSPSCLERSYKFKDFDAAWSWMSAVSDRCKETNHHPEWVNVYNEVHVRWTTHHKALGVRKKDRNMATICDELAEQHVAEVVQASELRKLAADFGQGGRDCCTVGPGSKAEEKRKIEQEEGDDGKEGSVAGVGGQPS